MTDGQREWLQSLWRTYLMYMKVGLIGCVIGLVVVLCKWLWA